MKTLQLVTITETGNYLLQFVGCIDTHTLDISLGRDSIPLTLLGEILGQLEERSMKASQGKKKRKGPGQYPQDIPVSIDSIKELWDSHDHDNDFERELELLEKMELIERDSLVLPEGTYKVKIGDHIVVDAELHGDFGIGCGESLHLYPTGLVDPRDDENPLMVCIWDGKSDYLICEGFLNDDNEPEYEIKVTIKV